MKPMYIKFSVPEVDFQFVRDVIGFRNVDEYLQDKIRSDKRYGEYIKSKQ